MKDQILSPRFDMAIKMLGSIQYKTIVDVGCGEFAMLTRYLIKKNCKVIAIELNLKSIRKAKRIINRCTDNLNFLAGSASNLPIINQSVDAIFMLEVLEHLPLNKDVIALNEIRRILKNRGLLILSVPNNYFIINILDPHWLLGHRHYKLPNLKSILIHTSLNIHDLFVIGGFLNSLGYILYLPWHLIWSHWIRSEIEPTFPLQKYVDKISYMEFTPRRVGNYIFCKAIKE